MTVRSLRSTLAAFRAGAGDPTTRLDARSFLHATLTPDGPGTLWLRWGRDPSPVDESVIATEAWGPGADWLVAGVSRLTGSDDSPAAAAEALAGRCPVVSRALRLTSTTHIGASGNLYHLLLATVVQQRITSRAAHQQWRRLCRTLGGPAPGPAGVVAGLVLPPAPDDLGGKPPWWFHRFGIEEKRARALREVARHHDHLWRWASAAMSGSASPDQVASRLTLLPGIGPWTAGSVLGPALGDPDAVPVGDFHIPDIVAWNLAGEARADDARMLELLEPFRGQRGRVIDALARAGRPKPAFGPRRRVLAIEHL